VISGRFSAASDPRFQEILAPLNVSHAQFFTNAIDTRTQGLDLGLNYEIPLANSTFKLSLNGNLSRTRLRKDEDGNSVIRTSSILKGYEDVLFNREEISRIEVAQPNTKIILSTTYQKRKWEFTLSTTRFGSVSYIHPEDGDPDNWVLNELTGEVMPRDQKFSAKWITDGSWSYRFSNRIVWTLGGSNIFNILPDKHTHSANITHGLFPYSRRVQQFGTRGAYWFTKVRIRF